LQLGVYKCINPYKKQNLVEISKEKKTAKRSGTTRTTKTLTDCGERERERVREQKKKTNSSQFSRHNNQPNRFNGKERILST
jgi:DNA-binding PadR family transcriptional regulator